ncbi:iron-responsive transcriptional regulator RirA [Bartonella sp. TP]|uniref:iron-responsive transcriptional regulator RirA n=1 Tax=Bartonella sp. TP TaxID=3057550 RepID=UPI0025B04987|nr:iron-responsive transcriptional regulator RirA [Bartonella sp. TP]MDN5248843.1 iron-responsive transcriptional regulator RirA [Alphaproteobacteria bacterium]WJW80089.1 iron-responsive transcriptional regulator RirA [Bartonella sp. TP]
MRLTKQTNYAIRILMYCDTNQGKLSQISEIAKAYNVSENFLFKILQSLVKANFVKTVRGRNGGIYLTKPAQEISVAEVIKVTEDNFAMAECFENEAAECPLLDSCGLNAAFNKALRAFFTVLEQTTIAQLQRPNFKERLGLAE